MPCAYNCLGTIPGSQTVSLVSNTEKTKTQRQNRFLVMGLPNRTLRTLYPEPSGSGCPGPRWLRVPGAPWGYGFPEPYWGSGCSEPQWLRVLGLQSQTPTGPQALMAPVKDYCVPDLGSQAPNGLYWIIRASGLQHLESIEANITTFI